MLFIQSSLLVILGLVPSFLWLLFYYREDCHPEPKHLLARVFLMGIILAPIAVGLQIGFVQLLNWLNGSQVTGVSYGPSFFLWAAFIEEVVKFGALYLTVLKRSEFDEPLDAMIYLITGALGFAAIENILILFQVINDGVISTASTLILRFIGATLLHALASGIMGYFLGMAWFYRHHSRKLIIAGLALATIFHFAFNMIISSFESPPSALLTTTFLLLAMSFLVSVLFDRLKVRSYC